MTRRFRPTLNIYLVLSYLVFVVGGLSATGLFWFSQQEASAAESLLVQLQERARLITTLNQMPIPSQSLDRKPVLLPGSVSAVNENLRVFYFDNAQQMQQISYQELTGAQRQQAITLDQETSPGALYEQQSGERLMNGEKILYVASPILDANRQAIGRVYWILPLAGFHATMQAYREELIRFAVGLAFLSLLVGLGLAHLLAQPIHQAGDMAAQVAGGDYSVRLKDQGPREIRDLAMNLNHMAGELGQQASIRQQLLSNVTHELARPLGALSLGVESLRAGAVNDADLAEDLLGEMARTLQDMEALIEDLAIAARPSHATLHLHRSAVALEPFLHGIQARYAALAETRGIQLRFDIPCELPSIEADEQRMKQIIGNLLDNSLKFCPTGAVVQVMVCAQADGVEISVQDSGPGIPHEDQGKVLQPFFQSKHGRQNRQGMGLGLAIVNQLVLAHQGTLQIENAPGGGLLATVWLPQHGSFTEN